MAATLGGAGCKQFAKSDASVQVPTGDAPQVNDLLRDPTSLALTNFGAAHFQETGGLSVLTLNHNLATSEGDFYQIQSCVEEKEEPCRQWWSAHRRIYLSGFAGRTTFTVRPCLDPAVSKDLDDFCGAPVTETVDIPPEELEAKALFGQVTAALGVLVDQNMDLALEARFSAMELVAAARVHSQCQPYRHQWHAYQLAKTIVAAGSMATIKFVSEFSGDFPEATSYDSLAAPAPVANDSPTLQLVAAEPSKQLVQQFVEAATIINDIRQLSAEKQQSLFVYGDPSHSQKMSQRDSGGSLSLTSSSEQPKKMRDARFIFSTDGLTRQRKQVAANRAAQTERFHKLTDMLALSRETAAALSQKQQNIETLLASIDQLQKNRLNQKKIYQRNRELFISRIDQEWESYRKKNAITTDRNNPAVRAAWLEHVGRSNYFFSMRRDLQLMYDTLETSRVGIKTLETGLEATLGGRKPAEARLQAIKSDKARADTQVKSYEAELNKIQPAVPSRNGVGEGNTKGFFSDWTNRVKNVLKLATESGAVRPCDELIWFSRELTDSLQDLKQNTILVTQLENELLDAMANGK